MFLECCLANVYIRIAWNNKNIDDDDGGGGDAMLCYINVHSKADS